MHDARRSFPPAPRQPRALVLTAHPKPDSFSHALAGAWADGATGLEVQQIDVATLAFDPCLHVAYRGDQPLEPDLLRVKQAIAEAAHVVVVFPLWWSSTPALLKGLFDRVLLPGWAFSYENDRPVGGLKGRSARVLVTMDAPTWYDRLLNGAAGRRQVSRGTLKFCGLSPVRTTAFGSIGSRTPAQLEAMLGQARKAGAQDAAAVLRRLAGEAR
jgi:putative NADPH-quinone reductase